MAATFLGARWALGLVLLSAGCAKLLTQDMQRRTEAIANYGLVPRRWRTSAAGVLPWLETSLGLLLIVGVAVSVTSVIVTALLALFAVVAGWHVSRGRNFDCGCGTSTDTAISWRLVARNTALAGLALGVAFGPSGYLAVWPDCFSGGHYDLTAQNLLPIPMLVVICGAIWRLTRGRISGSLGVLMAPYRQTRMPPLALRGREGAVP